MRAWIRGAAESLFVTFFPSFCRLCHAPLTNISRLPVCEACLAAVRPVSDALCAICGEQIPGPLAASAPEALCGLCRRSRPEYVQARAFGGYAGTLRGLIHLLKYEQVRPAAKLLGGLLAEVIAEMPLQGRSLLVVPVPLHKSKARQRGFNQAEQIARFALRQLAGNLQLNSRVLERQRPTSPQIGLTRHQRRENLRGAFRVVVPEEVRGREILLVDDVFTTGTTVSACTRVLRRAGASKIWIATVARTFKEGAGSAVYSQAA